MGEAMYINRCHSSLGWREDKEGKRTIEAFYDSLLGELINTPLNEFMP